LMHIAVNENDLSVLKTHYTHLQNGFTVMVASSGMKKDMNTIMALTELVNRELKTSGISFEEVKIDNYRCVYVIEAITNVQEEVLQKLPEKSRNVYGMQMYIGVGGDVQDIHDLHESYEKALSALRFAMIRQAGEGIFYESIKDIEKSKICYSLETRYLLMNEIKKGEDARVAEILDEIYQMNFCDRCLSYVNLRILIQGIAQTILELVDDIYSEKQDEHERYVRSCYYLLNHMDVSESFCEFCKICMSLCRKHTQSDSNLELRNRIDEYIEQNYCNAELSLEMLSDYIGMSYSYMSRSFKEYFGTNFKQYITEMRMKKACELLSEDKYSVKEVAAMIGCYSSNSFIRLFKKYYGTTPEKYTKQVNNRL